MDTIISFQDVLKKSILNLDQFGQVSVITVVAGLMVSLVLGLFIFYIYKKAFRGVVYHHSFNVTLVLMTMVTSLVIMTISTNIVLSLGMVGALSIVRFRTAVKDPLDIVFMFWAISVGIATGAGVYAIAVGGSIVIAITTLMLSRMKFKDSSYLLIINYTEKANQQINIILDEMKHVLKSKTIKADHIELVIEVKIVNNEITFINKLSAIEGVEDASLVSYNGDYAP
jgi:uncharacterized membrane protein YhiD involved in acid resistance